MGALVKDSGTSYDPIHLQNWQISQAAEEKMPTPLEWRERLGLERDEVIGRRLVNCYKATVSVHGKRDPRSYG